MAQFVRKVEYESMQEISELELLDVYSERCGERKDGSVGSTGTK